MLKILIPEKIPAHNKGEEAIFRGILKTLDFIPEKKIYLYSESPYYDKSQYREDAEIITESLTIAGEDSRAKKILHILRQIPLHIGYAFVYKISPNFARRTFTKKIWRVYDEIDFVLTGHDTAYTVGHNLLILFCKVIDKPIIIYGASIVPSIYRRIWARYLTRFCLNKADLITTREEISHRILVEKVGINKTLAKPTGDKGFLLDPIDKPEAIKLLEDQGVAVGEETIIGMTVVNKSGLFGRLKVDVDRHLDVISTLVDFIVEKTEAKVVFFPHSIGPKEASDDRLAAKAVYGKCSRKDNIKLLMGDFSAAELKGMIGCCDFFVGERTHSVIAATSMKVPAVVISHPEDYRTVGILGEMVGIDKWICNVKELEIDLLKQFFLDAWNSREELKKSLSQRIPLVTEKSIKNREYLQELLKSRGIV